MPETKTMPLGIGEHPDWRFWPEKGRYPIIEGERWMLCTDGCYFVRLDHPGMLIPAEGSCTDCGCPLHPASRCDRCLAHQEDDEEGDWEEDEDEDEDDEDWDDQEEEDEDLDDEEG